MASSPDLKKDLYVTYNVHTLYIVAMVTP